MSLRATIAILVAMGLARGLAPGIAHAQESPRIPCAAGDKPCILKLLASHPARRAGFWNPVLARPVARRMGPAPRELVEYLTSTTSPRLFREAAGSALKDDFVATSRGRSPTCRRPCNACSATRAGVWLWRARRDRLHGHVPRRRRQPVGGFVVLDAAVLEGSPRMHGPRGRRTRRSSPRGTGRWKRGSRTPRRTIAVAPSATSAARVGHVLSINRGIHPRWDWRRGRAGVGAFRSSSFHGRSSARKP